MKSFLAGIVFIFAASGLVAMAENQISYQKHVWSQAEKARRFRFTPIPTVNPLQTNTATFTPTPTVFATVTMVVTPVRRGSLP